MLVKVEARIPKSCVIIPPLSLSKETYFAWDGQQASLSGLSNPAKLILLHAMLSVGKQSC
jgi:hypothetical protein